jgi:hypothetical protein
MNIIELYLCLYVFETNKSFQTKKNDAFASLWKSLDTSTIMGNHLSTDYKSMQAFQSA